MVFEWMCDSLTVTHLPALLRIVCHYLEYVLTTLSDTQLKMIMTLYLQREKVSEAAACCSLQDIVSTRCVEKQVPMCMFSVV